MKLTWLCLLGVCLAMVVAVTQARSTADLYKRDRSGDDSDSRDNSKSDDSSSSKSSESKDNSKSGDSSRSDSSESNDNSKSDEKRDVSDDSDGPDNSKSSDSSDSKDSSKSDDSSESQDNSKTDDRRDMSDDDSDSRDSSKSDDSSSSKSSESKDNSKSGDSSRSDSSESNDNSKSDEKRDMSDDSDGPDNSKSGDSSDSKDSSKSDEDSDSKDDSKSGDSSRSDSSESNDSSKSDEGSDSRDSSKSDDKRDTTGTDSDDHSSSSEEDSDGSNDKDGDDDTNDTNDASKGSEDNHKNEEDVESIDSVIVNSADHANEFDFFYSPDSFDPKKSLIKVELDMVFTAEEYEERYSNSSSENKTVEKRTAAIINGRQGGYRWTNNHIPYQIASGTFSSYAIGQIKGAMSDWSRYTCLTFSRAYSGNRIYFQNGGGCSSRVGMVGGAQPVSLAGGCRVKGVVTHEIGHAIGLHHEQTRPDRDNYVRIITRNIPDSLEYNFQKHSWNLIQNLGIPYDYLSIMHYGSTAFTMNNGLTIQTLDPKYQNIIGRRRRLSFRDIKTVNMMYDCAKDNKCKLKDSDCPDEGFVGKDCKCWCPGDPYVLCKMTGNKTGGKTIDKIETTTETTTATTTGTKTGTKTGGKTKKCIDSHTKCSYWARYNQCSASYAFMSVYCKKSCNLCEGTTTVSSCRDYQSSCPTWAYNNYCNAYYYQSYMRSNCPKSCGLCVSHDDPNAPTDCKDENTYCRTLAFNGKCNTAYAKSKCKKSCDYCDNSAASAFATSSSCTNDHHDCEAWANTGECSSNPRYMKKHCKKACKVDGC